VGGAANIIITNITFNTTSSSVRQLPQMALYAGDNCTLTNLRLDSNYNSSAPALILGCSRTIVDQLTASAISIQTTGASQNLVLENQVNSVFQVGSITLDPNPYLVAPTNSLLANTLFVNRGTYLPLGSTYCLSFLDSSRYWQLIFVLGPVFTTPLIFTSTSVWTYHLNRQNYLSFNASSPSVLSGKLLMVSDEINPDLIPYFYNITVGLGSFTLDNISTVVDPAIHLEVGVDFRLEEGPSVLFAVSGVMAPFDPPATPPVNTPVDTPVNTPIDSPTSPPEIAPTDPLAAPLVPVIAPADTEPTTMPSTSNQGPVQDNNGAMIGGVVGGILGALLIATMIIIIVLKRRRARDDAKSKDSNLPASGVSGSSTAASNTQISHTGDTPYLPVEAAPGSSKVEMDVLNGDSRETSEDGPKQPQEESEEEEKDSTTESNERTLHSAALSADSPRSDVDIQRWKIHFSELVLGSRATNFLEEKQSSYDNVRFTQENRSVREVMELFTKENGVI